MKHRTRLANFVLAPACRYLRGAVVLLALLSSAGHAARAETCLCRDAAFAWRGCDSGDCDDAGWTGCSDATPDDSYVIEAGCAVSVAPGDDVLLDQPAGNRVIVRPGGSLAVSGPVEWRVGPSGLLAEPGSSVTFSGCHRRHAALGGECAPALGPESLFPIGLVLPCRDLDCSDDADTVRLLYPPDRLTADISDLIARIDVGRDALCFWQDGGTPYVGADAGYCYAIRGTGEEAGGRWLDFDIRQVWRAQSDQAGYPLERREVHQATLEGEHAAGARTLRFRESDVVVGRTDQMGRWVRCGGEQRAYLIATVRDDPQGDALVLADDRGLEQGQPAGTRCHVDWGWAAGDAAFVMAPVHVTSATNRRDEGYLSLQGQASIGALVVDGLGGDGDRGALQLRGADLTRFEHVWVTDPLVTDTAAVWLEDLPCDRGVFHLTVTGGPPSAADDKNYALAWFGGATCSYSLTDLYTRFVGDDNFVLESTGASPVGEIRWNRVQAGPASRPGDSGQFLDFGFPNPTNVIGSDGICTACTSQDGWGPLISPSSGIGEQSHIVWVGAFNGGLHGNGTESDRPNFHYTHVAVIGSAPDPENERGGGAIAGLNTEDFYVRDIEDPRADSNQLCTANQWGTFTHRLDRGIFARVALGGAPCELGGDVALSNLYFLDVTRTGFAGAIVETRGTVANARLSKLTLAASAVPPVPQGGVRIAAGTAPGVLLDGLLLAGFRGWSYPAMSVGSAMAAQAITWGAPSCFWENGVDEAPETLAAYGVPPVQGVDPRFVDPASSRFDLAPDSPMPALGCGARGAGIQRRDWAHRKLKLQPMYLGPRQRACGLFGVELFGIVLAREARRLVRRHPPGSRPRARCGSGSEGASGRRRSST